MDFSKEPLLQLVELSIIGVKDAYNEVFERLVNILKTCFWKITKGFSYDLEIEAFIGFAWSWILEKEKMHSLYYRFRKENLAEKQYEEFVKRYYYSIARSAVLAFLKEEFPAFRPNGKKVIDPETGEKILVGDYLEIPFTEDYEEGIPVVFSVLQNKGELTVYSPEKMLEKESAEELLKDLLTTISECKHKQRISFWLVYLSRFYPLPDIDIEWLAELNECGSEDIRSRISEGIEDNVGRKFSVSSEFAGDILKECKNNVTVRNRRLLKTLSPEFKSLMEN